MMASKAERLRVAASMAAPLRAKTFYVDVRKITVVDRATGRPLRVITDVEFAKALAKRAEIEFDSYTGQLRKVVPCRVCGKSLLAPRGLSTKAGRGRIPICRSHFVCACGGSVSAASFMPCKIRKRGGAPPTCHACHARRIGVGARAAAAANDAVRKSRGEKRSQRPVERQSWAERYASSAARHRQAAELRLAGATYARIAEALGYGSKSAVNRAVTNGLALIGRGPAPRSKSPDTRGANPAHVAAEPA